MKRAILLTGLLVLAGCGPWINPDNPASVALACGDVRAVMATAADVALTEKEADLECATGIAEIFEAFSDAIRENSPETVALAMDKLLETTANEIDAPLYRRLLKRVAERVKERLDYMHEAPEDAQAANGAKLLSSAALDGTAQGAREYAAGLTP